MKKIISILVVCTALFAFSGCGSTHYTVTKTDGSTIVSVGEPNYFDKSKSYELKDLDGQKVILKREDVKEIKENKD
ncbi:YgdI/YgdR family lipoprotein [Maridesulfovibrio ferrireducens]|uniref:YgdI/YgdR family lipoprotein n=1 Tax=Maridesulfovibrio ferrireducens TaxID=246191 RepID=UPI001A24807C|nr:YgdI/YgdR family lipoprotein [Maridesulfovibrio ferrireducens]MBI9111645.1 YgdI/YgdR family lipoprotein [Maridesulfovibrio ferrireducens]